MAKKVDIKKFRESVERGKKNEEKFRAEGCQEDISLIIDYDEDKKPIYLKANIYIQGMTCDGIATFYTLSDREENPISKYVAGILGGCYDEKGGELLFNESDAKFLDHAVNAAQVLILFCKITSMSGLSEDDANAEKPS